MRDIRPISWIMAARRDFEDFPEDVQGDMLGALTKKKSKTGIKTPQMDVGIIRERLKRLKEALK